MAGPFLDFEYYNSSSGILKASKSIFSPLCRMNILDSKMQWKSIAFAKNWLSDTRQIQT